MQTFGHFLSNQQENNLLIEVRDLLILTEVDPFDWVADFLESENQELAASYIHLINEQGVASATGGAMGDMWGGLKQAGQALWGGMKTGWGRMKDAFTGPEARVRQANVAMDNLAKLFQSPEMKNISVAPNFAGYLGKMKEKLNAVWNKHKSQFQYQSNPGQVNPAQGGYGINQPTQPAQGAPSTQGAQPVQGESLSLPQPPMPGEKTKAPPELLKAFLHMAEYGNGGQDESIHKLVAQAVKAFGYDQVSHWYRHAVGGAKHYSNYNQYWDAFMKDPKKYGY